MANDANIKWGEKKKKKKKSLTLPVMERNQKPNHQKAQTIWMLPSGKKRKKNEAHDIIIEPFSGRNDDVATPNSSQKKIILFYEKMKKLKSHPILANDITNFKSRKKKSAKFEKKINDEIQTIYEN